MSAMHLVDSDETPVPRNKRRCRTSKKKRLRLKKRVSLEPKAETKQVEIAGTRDEEKQAETHTEREDQVDDHKSPEEQRVEVQQQQQEHEISPQECSHYHNEAHVLVPSQDEGQDLKKNSAEEHEEEELEEMTEYERKRRANILRNQAYMKVVGMSTAKLAARTTIGNEAEKAAKRQRLAEKRAARAAQQPQPGQQRLSLRVRMRHCNENVRARARWMAHKGVNVSVPGMKVPSGDEVAVHLHRDSKDIQYTQKSVMKTSTSIINRSAKEKGDRRQEPQSYELQAVRRDAYVKRLARMAEKSENKTVNITSTDLPPVEAKRQPSGDNLVAQQPLEALPYRSTDPVEILRPNKQEIGQAEEQECHSGKEAHGEMTAVERYRRENILRNQAFMQQVGMSTCKFAARTAIGNEAEKGTKKQALAVKRAALTTAGDELPKRPVRKSRRLEREVVVDLLDRGHPLDLLTLKTARRGCNKVHFMDAMDEEGKVFLENLTAHFKLPVVTLKKDAPWIDGDDVEYILADKDIARVVPDPIRALAFLPRADRVVLASGDKEGHIALWSPSSHAVDHMKYDSSAVLYRPHGYAVSQLLFPDATSLISSSFDGTVREFDLWTSELSVVCETGFRISALAASGNPQFYYAGCDDGTLRLIDRRARNPDRLGYPLHDARINTLDQHPRLDYCIATASQDNTVCLWDKRRISPELNVPLATLAHAGTVDCAYFSPRNGAWLATVSQDSYVNIYDTSILSRRKDYDALPIQLPRPARTQLENGTGNGSNFVLHAAWDPKRINQFVVGSREKPPRIQIFHTGRHHTVRQLTSSNFDTNYMYPVNVFHPHLDLIASSCSGGRVALWRGKLKD